MNVNNVHKLIHVINVQKNILFIIKINVLIHVLLVFMKKNNHVQNVIHNVKVVINLINV